MPRLVAEVKICPDEAATALDETLDGLVGKKCCGSGFAFAEAVRDRAYAFETRVGADAARDRVKAGLAKMKRVATLQVTP